MARGRKSGQCSAIYLVYDTAMNDLFMGEFTSNEIAEMFNIQPRSVHRMVSRGSLIHRRFEVIRADSFLEDSEDDLSEL